MDRHHLHRRSHLPACAIRPLAILDANFDSPISFRSPNDFVNRQCMGSEIIFASSGGDLDTGGTGMVIRGGTWEMPPKDPLLYRLYEVLVVYGSSYKALIAEKFGDGIMSAINFRTTVEKKKDKDGDRVVITMDGKWLPYSTPDQWDMSASK